MTIEEVKEISQLLPTFVQMCENDMGEEEHEIPTPLTYEQYTKVEMLLRKLHSCNQFVDLTIFE